MAGKITTPLVSEVPELIKIWDLRRNAKIGNYPDKITVGSGKRVWFKCTNYLDHSFSSKPAEIVRGRGCGVCSGFQVWRGFNDFESHHPYESYFWDYSENRCRPSEVVKSSHEKFWFICEAGHRFHTSLSRIYSGRWCPHCSGHRVIPGVNDLASTHPQLVDQIDPRFEVDPTRIKTYSNRKIGWICSNNPDHKWTSVVANRTKRGDGCAICDQARKRSKAEIEIFNWIDTTLCPDLEVVPNDKSVLDGKHIDIYIPALKVGFEYNGNYWHKDKDDPTGPSVAKVILAQERGVNLYTIWEDDWRSDRTHWEEHIVKCIGLDTQ